MLFLLSRHYRSPLDYSRPGHAEAQMGLRRFYALLKDLENPESRLQMKGNETLTPDQKRETEEAIGRFRENFEEALEVISTPLRPSGTCMNWPGR